jgi:hypothetical protein
MSRVRSDKVQKGMWALKPNSPRALAYVRAHIFSFQALCAMGTENSIYSVAIYFDMVRRRRAPLGPHPSPRAGHAESSLRLLSDKVAVLSSPQDDKRLP